MNDDLWEGIKPAVRAEMNGLLQDTLKLLVRVGDEYGADALLRVMREMIDAPDADPNALREWLAGERP